MGSKYRQKKMAGVVTSVRIDVDVYTVAFRKGINISKVTNDALRSLLRVGEEDMTDEQVAQLLAERAGRVEEAVQQEAETVKQEAVAEGMTVETALGDLQFAWNGYLSNAPRASEGAKLAWVKGRRANMPALSGMTAEAILKELQGEM